MSDEPARAIDTAGPAHEIFLRVAQAVSIPIDEHFYEELTRRIVAALSVSGGIIALLDPNHPDRVRSQTLILHDRLIDNLGYELAGTPCQDIIRGEDRVFAAGIRQRFPNDPMLVRYALEAYAGTPVRDRAGGVIGLVAVFHDRPLEQPEVVLPTLRIFAARVATEIERQRAEQRLALLDFALSNTREAMYLIDQDARFVAVNDTASRMLGYTREELLGRFIPDVDPGYTMQHWQQHWATIRQTGGITLESIHQRKDGSIFPIEVTAHYFEHQGRGYNLALVRDISELRQAAARLQERESLLRLARKTARVGGWAINIADRRMSWSDEIGAILEYPPGVVPSVEESLSLYPPEYRETIEAALNACARDGTPFDLELELFTARGRRIWARAVGEAERNAEGCITRLFGAFQDISEWKRTEQERQRLAKRLQLTLEHMTDGFVLLDINWGFVYLNTEAERILRCRREDLLGRNMWDMFPEGRDTIAFAEYRLAMETGQPRHFELYYAPLAEWLEINAHPSGEGLALYFRTITARKALEDQLRRSQRLESIGQLTGGVAHDFNNLLTVIQGNAEQLVQELATDLRLRPLAEMVSSAAERSAELIHRLLAFARKQTLEPRMVAINELVAGMDRLLRRTLGEPIEIERLPGTGLWPVLIDPAQLESALLNLAINARDAMPGGGTLLIETRNITLDRDYAARHAYVQPGDYVLIAVSDTGCGIPPERLDRVFEPFYTTKEPGKGTGLGLSMVYGFVKQSGGHIQLYSEPGRGTTVKLYLPRAIAEPEAPPAAESTPEPVVGREAILLVEDDALVRQYAEGQLKMLGYRVLSAEHGPAALTVLREHPDIDLLFTDVVMPGGMNGRELADAARALRPGLKVLYTSGYTENAIVHHGRLDPGALLLSKPYRRSELARKIREALAGT